MSDVPFVRFNNGVEIPQLGFGVFQVPPSDTAEVVLDALKAGYRHIDTAQMYGNEKGVGQAVAQAGIDRNDLFITSKLNNDAHGRDKALRAFEGTLADLGLEKIDLFLIHWPMPAQGLFVETWQALEEVYRDGRARAIGVSNFTAHHLGRLAAETEVTPALDQVELHPYFTQVPQRAYDADHEIATEAWSPIGGQGGKILDDPTVVALAKKYGKSPAQVILRWHIQLGNVVIPKSVTPSRIAENIDIFDFELETEDETMISALNKDERTGPDPDKFP